MVLYFYDSGHISHLSLYQWSYQVIRLATQQVVQNFTTACIACGTSVAFAWLSRFQFCHPIVRSLLCVGVCQAETIVEHSISIIVNWIIWLVTATTTQEIQTAKKQFYKWMQNKSIFFLSSDCWTLCRAEFRLTRPL